MPLVLFAVLVVAVAAPFGAMFMDRRDGKLDNRWRRR